MDARRGDEARSGHAWWLVLCLIGLDYFSTLAYLPSLAVQAVGPLAPVAAMAVVAVTLLAALPIYCFVVGRSPHGRGATGLIERRVPGWTGKLLVLFLLAFVATDYVVTQNLSVADAAEHLRGNPLFRAHVDPWIDAHWSTERWLPHPRWQWFARTIDRQLVVTLLLSLASFVSWALWRRGSTRLFLRVAAILVGLYLALNFVVLGSALAHLSGPGRAMFDDWWKSVQVDMGRAGDGSSIGWQCWQAIRLALVAFPYVALGLSGFELSMAVTPFVAGDVNDDVRDPRGRIRNTRKLLVVAALLMAVLILAAVTITATLIPPNAFAPGGQAAHRALAYLAHGGLLADGEPASAINRAFGPGLGTVYDLATIGMLCLAGACVAIALRDYVPESLQRFGMELEWAHRLGGKMRFFNLVVLVVVVLFRAHIEALQWVYATSVLVLLSGGTLAAIIELRSSLPSGDWRRLAITPTALVLLFFVGMAFLTVAISRAGLEIALAFGIGILLTSFASRWLRSIELRFSGFEFDDDESRQRWERCCRLEFQVLVPHRPGLRSRQEKERSIREQHRLAPDVPIILIEAELGDPSNFMQIPLMRVSRTDGFELIQVSRCVSIAHVLAAIALHMSREGRPSELHFGWSDDAPLAANLGFLLFGEGNIPWMVRELVRRAEPIEERRPRIVVG